jgi:pimeloyl-ACP methyl ester carboxylesterase
VIERGGEVREFNRKVLVMAVALMAVAMLATPLTSIVQAKKSTKTDMGDYTEYVGALGGANFVIRIPNEGWNGMLVVGCHGYRMDWGPDDQFAVDGLVNSDGVGLPFALVEQGFAYAASSYGEGGWCIQKAMIRTHQLTEYVIDNFDVTGKVFLIGHSMGGNIVLLLGEKYPELYDGVLDSCGMRDVVQAYISGVTMINSPVFPTLPPPVQAFMLQAVADWEAEFGGSYYDKPKAYEKKNPIDNAEISIPIISVNGAQDPMSSPYQQTVYGLAVDAAGCSEYYRTYTVDPGMHGDPPVIDEVLLRLWELVDYPVGW